MTADLTALAQSYFPDVGADQHAAFPVVSIRARNGASATYDLDDFELTIEHTGEELRDLQRSYLDSLPYEPLHLVGVEISMFLTGHLNAFGSSVPFYPYAERNDPDIRTAVDFVHEHGGLVSYNHMFGVDIQTVDALTRATYVANAIDQFLAQDVYGCDMLEVGYRERVGILDDFLEVWDALSVSGRVITGIGANDAHDQGNWDDRANRFVTWVASASPAEVDLLWHLGRGAAWFGDPTLFPEGQSFADVYTEGGARMGQVVIDATGPQDVTFEADPLRAGWQVRRVENGVRTATWQVSTDGSFSVTEPIDPSGGNVVRFEVLTDEDEPALYTNPIYFYEGVDAATIAPERLPDP